MSTAAEDQGWKPQQREDDEALRLLRHKPRWCDLCAAFGTHHTDMHDDDQEDFVDVHAQVQKCRETIRETEAGE